MNLAQYLLTLSKPKLKSLCWMAKVPATGSKLALVGSLCECVERWIPRLGDPPEYTYSNSVNRGKGPLVQVER